jgi:hypothetical protein
MKRLLAKSGENVRVRRAGKFTSLNSRSALKECKLKLTKLQSVTLAGP